MRRRKLILDFLEESVKIFGFTILCLAFFTVAFGEEAQIFSSIFSLGKEGLAVSTIFQFGLTSIGITALRRLLFTDVFIKNLSITLRTVTLFLSVLVFIAVCIILFDWFPVGNIKAWGLFLICFAICAVGSIIISGMKESDENKRMEEALQRLKDEE